VVFISACSFNNSRRKQFIDYSTEINQSYLIKGVLNHFPDELDDASIKQMLIAISADYLTSELYVVQSISREDATVLLSNQKFIQKKEYYDTSNFIMTLDWLWDSTNLHHSHTSQQLKNLPIPDFVPIEFNGKTISYDEMLDGKLIKLTKQAVPEDLIVYVIDSKPGNFWIKKNKCVRPPMLTNWIHGYSRGIAYSELQSILVYWLIIW
jgi:hypothetical protein